ncbi:MAG: membrane protein insertase YidC [Opitutales bacterium]
MDKKNTFLGIIFVLAGIAFMFWQSQQLEEQRRQQLQQLQQEQTLSDRSEATGPSTSPSDAAFEQAEASGAERTKPSAVVQDLFSRVESEPMLPGEPLGEEKILTLANEYIEVVLTTRGGAIRKVEFLQTKRGERDDYVFNQDGHLPALSLSYQAAEGDLREYARDFNIVAQTATSVTFVLETGEGMSIRRSYRIAAADSGPDPYLIEHSTELVNGSDSSMSARRFYFNLGTARPIAEEQIGFNFLNVGHFNGDKAKFIAIKKLTGSSGFLGIGANSPREFIQETGRMEWTSVKNQFFASVLSSSVPASDLFVLPVEGLPSEDGRPGRLGITGSAGYDVGILDPGQSRALEFQFYVGPKEFKRLQSMGNEQDLVMQFGFLGFFSKLLLAFMYAIHSVIPSWGWSIVIMTICIKTLFWPLTAKASKSQKRMAKIQGPMAELKEKYKDNPQKMQQETMKLFKEHQVNPLAGCLPMLIQMPIFLGLFYMLRTASELRFEPFLWVSDLSQPDTIMEIGGFPLNLMPLLMGLTMFLQMQMMPVSPTADPMQQKIFKFMPAIFLIFLYNFSSGLTLYWTVQNILTIIQQKIINSRPDPEPVAAVATTSTKPKAGGKARKKKK